MILSANDIFYLLKQDSFLNMLQRRRKFYQTNSAMHAGFSLLEVVIAMFVLSVGMLGVMQLMSGTLRHSFNQRDAVVASQLAQEGVELVYNIRDTNMVGGSPAFNGIGNGSGWRIDATSSTPALSGGAFGLYERTSDHVYTHNSSGGTATKFSRKILVDEINSSGIISKKVTSFVVWSGGAFPMNASNPEASCLVGSRCAFAQVILQDY